MISQEKKRNLRRERRTTGITARQQRIRRRVELGKPRDRIEVRRAVVLMAGSKRNAQKPPR